MDDNVAKNYPVGSVEELDALIERERSSGWATMDPVHKAFAHLYLESYNHREAAAEIGRPKSAGIRLLRDPMIASYIRELQEQSKLSSIVTKDFINMQYLKLLGYAMGQEDMPIMLATGEQVVGRKVMVGEAKNILAEMAKSTEYAKETGTKNAPVSISINMGDLFGEANLPSDASVVIDGEILE